MHKQREWRNELEKMKIGNVVGSLSIESKTLRASLIPITQRTLEQVIASQAGDLLSISIRRSPEHPLLRESQQEEQPLLHVMSAAEQHL